MAILSDDGGPFSAWGVKQVRSVRVLVLAVLSTLLTVPLSTLAKPNVILFTVDSCRADRFGTFGYRGRTTPNIDRWARSGTIFRSAYSTSAWTAPGLASLLTGLYPRVHGIDSRDRMGAATLMTLVKMFRAAGYRVPNLNFFTFAPYYLHLGLPPIDREYLGGRESAAILNWLSKNATADGHPFFVWYHTTTVHQPYRPEASELPAPLAELEKRPGIRAVLNGAIVPFGSTRFDPEDKPILDALYDGEMRRVDRLFGQMLELLRDRGLADSTLIILSADHGEELLDHGFVGHASTSLHAKLYEELIHIPLILSWPGHVPEGLVVADPVSQVDVLPTVARLLGLEAPHGVQGIDLFQSRPDRPLYLESVSGGNQTPKSRENEWIRAIRLGRWKYISTEELYDLVLDPTEETNVIGQEPTVADRLRSRMADFFSQCDALSKTLFPAQPEPSPAGPITQCPRIFTPGDGTVLDYDLHTGALLFDWEGDMETSYLIEYDIGTGDHHVEGEYEVQGNHQVFGPLPRELWTNMKEWNPFRIRISPKQSPPCWSQWVEFRF